MQLHSGIEVSVVLVIWREESLPFKTSVALNLSGQDRRREEYRKTTMGGGGGGGGK